MTLRAGQWLYASCSAEWYGPILRVAKDEGGIDGGPSGDVLDIWLPIKEFTGPFEHFGPTGPGMMYATDKHWNNVLTTVKDHPRVAAIVDGLEEKGLDSEIVGAMRRLARGEALFIGLQWKSVDKNLIQVNTPGDGCYRCTQLFIVYDTKES